MPNIDKFYDPNYLCSAIFDEGEKKTLTIRAVKSDFSYSQFRKKQERKAQIFFKEKSVLKDENAKPILDDRGKQIIVEVPPFIPNATNRATLKAKFGSDTDNWIGKQITIYVDPKVRVGGRTMCGLRIQGETVAVVAPTIPCDCCTEIITKTAKNTIERLIEIGQETYGQNLCAKCLAAKAAEGQTE